MCSRLGYYGQKISQFDDVELCAERGIKGGRSPLAGIERAAARRGCRAEPAVVVEQRSRWVSGLVLSLRSTGSRGGLLADLHRCLGDDADQIGPCQAPGGRTSTRSVV